MGSVPAITVAKTGGCPICGHPDWCYWLHYEDQETDFECQLIVCNRDSAKTCTCGVDGCEYIYKWDIKSSGASVYMKREDDELRKEMWAAKHGKKLSYDTKKKIEFRKATVTASPRREKAVPPLPNERCDKITRYLMSLLSLDELHANYYLEKQHWTKEMLVDSGIRSVPKDMRSIVARIEAKFGKGCLLGFPGAFQTPTGDWSILCRSGILVPLYDLNGNMFRLRNRRDFLDVSRNITKNQYGEYVFTEKTAVPRVREGKVIGTKMDSSGNGVFEELKHVVVPMKGVFIVTEDEVTGKKVRVPDKAAMKGGKYIWVSASEKVNPKTGQPVFVNGCSTDSEPGLFVHEGDNTSMCFLIEGELKCMITSHTQKVAAISLPGVGNWETVFQKGYIDEMTRRGTKMWCVAFDADKAQNEAVQNFENQLVAALKKSGHQTVIVDWDPKNGKGIDDCILAGGSPLYHLV